MGWELQDPLDRHGKGSVAILLKHGNRFRGPFPTMTVCVEVIDACSVVTKFQRFLDPDCCTLRILAGDIRWHCLGSMDGGSYTGPRPFCGKLCVHFNRHIP